MNLIPSKESNKQRKALQRATYHSQFHPHVKPRSRRWEIRYEESQLRTRKR